jgi:hypothetical protein
LATKVSLATGFSHSALFSFENWTVPCGMMVRRLALGALLTILRAIRDAPHRLAFPAKKLNRTRKGQILRL